MGGDMGLLWRKCLLSRPCSLLHSSNVWLGRGVQSPVLVCQFLLWETLCAHPLHVNQLVVIHPFLLWLLYCCLVVLYPSWPRFTVVDVHVHSEIVCCRKTQYKNFLGAHSCMKIFCKKRLHDLFFVSACVLGLFTTDI